MSESKRYTVLVAVDGSDASLMVMQHAINVAARYPSVDLQVASIYHTGRWHKSDPSEQQQQALQRTLAEYLGEALNDFEGLDVSDWRMRLIVREGDVHEELVFLAEWGQADLVVVGRAHLSGAASSSGVTQALVDEVNCPILVVKPKQHRPSQDVEYTGSGRVMTMSSWMAPSALSGNLGGVS